MLRLGIVGCGRVTTMFHLRAIKEVEGLIPFAVMDRHEVNMIKVKKICGAKRHYASFSELLKDSDVDALVINTPPKFHEDMVIESLRAGKHVLCEKPLATSVDGGLRIKEEAEASGFTVMAVHNYSFTPCLGSIESQILSGVLGDVKKVSVRFETNLKNYGAKTDFRLENEFGIVEDVLPHILSTIHKIAGRAVKVLDTECMKKSFRVIDNLNLVMETERGVEIESFMSWTKIIPSFSMSITGEYGSINTDLIRMPYGYKANIKGDKREVFERKGFKVYFDLLRFRHPGFVNQYSHFNKVVAKDELPKFTIDDEIDIIRMMQNTLLYLAENNIQV
ncbi:MAG: Gfo/Idh/MocA family protein [Candidatus Bathyarchaeia archaeon]